MKSKNLPELVPERMTWLRAAVTSIPVVGGALDHLLFDKADEIRLRNIESAVNALSEQIQKFDDSILDKEWFSSEEALATFRLMADNVSFEPDVKKVEDLGRIVAACGEHKHSTDPRKLSIIEHLSRLSHVQIKLLSVISTVPLQKKSVSSGGLEQTATAIWTSDVLNKLKTGTKFWDGTMKLDEELEVLASFNTIRRVELMGPSEAAYVLTGIGRQAAEYAKTAGL